MVGVAMSDPKHPSWAKPSVVEDDDHHVGRARRGAGRRREAGGRLGDGAPDAGRSVHGPGTVRRLGGSLAVQQPRIRPNAEGRSDLHELPGAAVLELVEGVGEGVTQGGARLLGGP